MPLIFIITITLLSLVYFLALLILERALHKIPLPENSAATEKNSVTVIVCARNEQKNLPGLFTCLEQQKTATPYIEFIIVNDRSEDNTAELIRRQAAKDSRFKQIDIHEKRAGFAPKKRAIDEAVRQAKGDILLLTDADGRPGPDWITSMLDYFHNGADMVIGYAPFIAEADSGIFKKMLALEYFSVAMIAASSTALGYPVTCVGTNFAYRKKVYQETGGFGKYKSFISGDDDLFLTLVREQKKYNIQYAANKKSHVLNNPPRTFTQFVNQRLRFASKGFNYPFKVALILTLYVIFNLMIPSGFIWGILGNQPVLLITLLIILGKNIFEFKYLKKAAKTLSDQRFTNYYFLTALLHLPYVLFFGIFGQFKFFKWAEDKVEHGVLKKAG